MTHGSMTIMSFAVNTRRGTIPTELCMFNLTIRCRTWMQCPYSRTASPTRISLFLVGFEAGCVLVVVVAVLVVVFLKRSGTDELLSKDRAVRRVQLRVMTKSGTGIIIRRDGTGIVIGDDPGPAAVRSGEASPVLSADELGRVMTGMGRDPVSGAQK